MELIQSLALVRPRGMDPPLALNELARLLPVLDLGEASANLLAEQLQGRFLLFAAARWAGNEVSVPFASSTSRDADPHK
jgi:hypothetical protein